MTCDVYQIDAWYYDESWSYNNSFYLGERKIKGEPTTRKILNLLRKNEWLNKIPVYIDESLSYQGVYVICRKGTDEPLFEVQFEGMK